MRRAASLACVFSTSPLDNTLQALRSEKNAQIARFKQDLEELLQAMMELQRYQKERDREKQQIDEIMSPSAGTANTQDTGAAANERSQPAGKDAGRSVYHGPTGGGGVAGYGYGTASSAQELSGELDLSHLHDPFLDAIS